ncbi:MAG TPA: alanine dehydrogenase, partial [Aggregatilineales bacterium]|nr:alanine dehydrogenase [Aggregatilineales bacterium]
MLIGVPREIKSDEYRVAMTPAGAREMIAHGHQVLVESKAGAGSGFLDEEYQRVGASIIDSAEEVWSRAEMITKVKEPIASEYQYLRENLILYTYLHLAAAEELTRVMVKSGITGIAYETVEQADGSLPLLQPMSEVAGRMATQVAANYLEKPHGGRGKLLGGIPGVSPATVVILGGGTVGTHAAYVAAGMGAHVIIVDVSLPRLRYLYEIMPGNVQTLYATQATIAESVEKADVVIGAVLI